MKAIDQQKPNRRMIERLFRDLFREFGGYRSCTDESLTSLTDKHEALERKLLKDSRLAKLAQQIKDLRKKYEATKERNMAKIKHLERRYLAGGITPALIKNLKAVIATLEKL